MPVDAKTRKALNLKKLRLSPDLPVRRLEVQDYTDSTGDPALRILAVVDESAEVNKNTGKAAIEFERSIMDSLQKHGIMLFPYVFYAKPSDLEATDEE